MLINVDIVKHIMENLHDDCKISYLSTAVMPFSTFGCVNCPYAVYTNKYGSRRCLNNRFRATVK